MGQQVGAQVEVVAGVMRGFVGKVLTEPSSDGLQNVENPDGQVYSVASRWLAPRQVVAFPGGAVAVTKTEFVVQFNRDSKGVWEDAVYPQDTAEQAFQALADYTDGATARMKAKYRVIERTSTVTETVLDA